MNDKSRKQVLFEEKREVIIVSPFLRRMLRFLQLLPADGQKNTTRHKPKTMILASVILNGPLIIGWTGYVFKGLLEGLRKELLEAIYYIYSWLLVMVIIFLWLSQAEEIGNFLEANDTFNFGVPRSYLTRRGLISTWNYLGLCIMNLINIGQVMMNNIYCLDEKYINREFCEFGLPLWYPMDVDNVFLKAYIYLSVISFALYYSNAGLVYFIVGESAFRIASRIRHLEHHLKCIKLGKNNDSDLEKLRFCIRYHTEIVGLVSNLNKTMGLLLFPEYTMLIGMLSLLEYEMIFMHSFVCIIGFLQWFYGPVVFCELGDLLDEEHEKLRWAVYSMNWYEMRPELRKTYLLLLGSVQNPVIFKAQPIAALNRECLLKIVKGSYTFLTFLGNFTDRN